MEWKLSRDVLQGITRYAYNAVNWDLSFWQGTIKKHRQSHDLEGVIAMIASQSDLRELQNASQKVLSYSNLASDLPIPRVVSDDHKVGVRAAEYYLSLGFSKFAYFSDHPAHNYSMERYAGFASCLAGADHEAVDLSGRKGVVSEIRKLSQPLAVYVADDVSAAYLINALIAAGIEVPGEVAVLGTNNDETFCALARVPMSSIGLSAPRIGFQAAKLLDQWIEHGQEPDPVTLIEPQDVFERQSTRSYGVSDVVVANAMQYIRNHAIGHVRVEDIAQSCGVGRRTLERRFDELLERSPHEAVIETRMDTAKKMLVQTDFSMEEIASRSGFSNKRQLSSTFRRVLNLTPSEYRRTHQLR
jgi:LacI family transcriptional regulator